MKKYDVWGEKVRAHGQDSECNCLGNRKDVFVLQIIGMWRTVIMDSEEPGLEQYKVRGYD